MTRQTAIQQFSSEELVPFGGTVLEGPCWDARAGRLLFVDIPTGRIAAMSWPTGNVVVTEFGESVSAVIPRASEGSVVACRRGIAVVDAGEARLAVPIETRSAWMRTNDAKCDPAGRLWVGTMADDERPRAGSLYRIDWTWECTKVVDHVSISNGLGWSPDGRRMYYIDSPTRRIDIFTYDLATGQASDRSMFIDTAAYAGLPDGMAVDAEGYLWVAFYGGSAVRRFAPDGSLVGVVDVPTPNVTSCAFAGADLDRLVITTARSTGADGSGSGGEIFVTMPGVQGQPTTRFAG